MVMRMTREEAKTSSQLSRKDYRSEGSIEVWKALLEEEQKPGGTENQILAARITKMIADIEDRHHGPSDAMHNPPQPLRIFQKISVSFLTEIKHVIY
ncbi:hypothetical protein Tco_0265002 [Tanacetum coccineum]